MRKAIRLWLVCGMLLVTYSFSQAQFLGQLSTAKSPGSGNSLVGGNFGIYEDAFSFFGHFRYGFTNYIDGGIKAGFINIDGGGGSDASGFLIGGDVKVQVLDAALGDPFDLAVGGGTEFAAVEDLNIFSLGGNVLGSYPFALSNGRHISPYARFNVRMERVSVDFPGGSVSDTDLELGLNLGTEVEVSNSWNVLGELFIENNIGFVLGVNFDLP